MIPRRGVKIKIFLSVVIPVVKAAFMLFSAIGENPANAGIARLCGVSPHPIPDTTTALPKQARYQLRYTRLLSYSIRLVVFSQSKRATNCANPGFLVIEFCARCGQTCGQAVFLTISACGGSACIAGISRDCGHGIFRLEGGATRSQTVCGNSAYYTSFLRVLQEGETLRMGGICRTTIHIEQEYNTRHGLQAIQ